jgi:RHS repeat-associated protein
MRKHFMISVSVALSIILLTNPLLIGASGKRGSVSPAKKLEPVSSLRSNRPLKPTRPRPITEEGQSSTLLPNGSWLLLGGQGANGPKNTAVVRDSFTGQTQELREKLHTPRAYHSATMLPDGRVLIFGGVGPNGKVVNRPEIFNSRALKFEPVTPARLPAPRAFHSATLLIDGSVLIAGGEVNGEVLANAELWNPKTGSQSVGGLNVARRKHEATLLADGNVLVQGGVDAAGNGLVNAAEIFNSEIRSFNWAGSFAEQADARPSFLTKSQPGDGATDVPVDSTIALLFSKPLRADTVNSQTCAIVGSAAEVLADVVPAEAGRLVFITPREPLETGTPYNVFVSGAVDPTNALVTSTAISFTTADDHKEKPNDNQPDTTSDPERWTPNARNFNGTWRSDYPDTHWQKLPPLSAAAGVTAVAGQVLALDGKALANVSLTIGGNTTRTDQTGRFLLQGMSAGHQVLVIDGRSANSRARTYGIFRVGVDVTGGKTDVLGYTIWMPRLDVEHAVNIQSPTSNEVTITNPDIPGLELRLPANTVIRDLDGQNVTNITITPIPVDRPPFPLPSGINVPIFFTIQPGGAQVIPPRARVIYPNYTNEKPGTRIDFWNYDPTEKGWYIYGQGTVTADGKQVIPDPGVAIYEFSGVMINTTTFDNPPDDGPVPCNPCEDADPVDLSTGRFVYRQMDLYVPDVIPITLERTYRNQDSASRPFGVGATHPYHMFLWSARQYREADLVLPDGGRVHFERTSAGEYFADGVFAAGSNPGPFYQSQLFWVGNGLNHVDIWNLRLRDGTTLVFGENAPLQAIIDRYGNRLNISRAGLNQFNSPVGNVTRVTSPNGKYIDFTYTGSRITKIKDNIGREVNYTYDAGGRLWKVIDPNNGVTEYSYDLSQRMTSIKDPRGIVYLTNEYDSNGRVRKQIMADDTPATISDNPTFLFNYVTNSGGKVLQTDVTDPRGNIRRVTFNDQGLWLTDTLAAGTSEEQSVFLERQAKTNLVLSGIDALGRRTAFTYDSIGRITSVTNLALTADAITTRYTYNGFLPSSITDPLGRTTYFAYADHNMLVAVVDPLGRRTTFENNLQGQAVLVTDPLGNKITFEYQDGLLVSFTDQKGRKITRTIDNVGRTVALTDPAGRRTLLEYDAVNQLKKATDPLGGVTEFTYDPNGNLLTLKDPRQKITTYTYDNVDRAITRTDPLQSANSTEHFEYDVGGNLKKRTDRRGKVTVYDYDHLDRMKFAGFGEISAGVYESTINYTYDLADRLRTAVDSTGGTITLDYDNYDALISEVTSQGSVGYTYDKVGRQKTMTVAGQATVNYEYDDVNRLKQISQGSATVKFSYDDADRLISKTLPNGILAEYSYDSAWQVTGITYRSGTTVLGNLTYEYDKAGKRTKVGGTFARVALPQALSQTAYNDANQLTQRATSNLTYDANGNLTNDGVNTYTWNARNELVSISGSGLNASFTYDAFGRRSVKTINGGTTEYLYDGLNAVQEKVGGTPAANMLTGGVDQGLTRTDANGPLHLLTDGLGSTLSLTDASGAETTQYTYEPFGQTSANGTPSNNSSQFTGRENDGTGLYYYRARYYSPTLQRFISEDPIGFAGGDLNLYAYTANDPVNSVDPSGEWFFVALGVVALILIYSKYANAPGPNDPIYDNDPAQEMVSDIPYMVLGGVVFGKVIRLVGRACGRILVRPPGRLPQDVNVNPRAPKPLPANRPIGSSPAQAAELQADIQAARAQGATDIRVNQQQVNGAGERVGVNRPDLQYTTPNGKRVHIEYDRNPASGLAHRQRIMANDRNCTVILKTIQ